MEGLHKLNIRVLVQPSAKNLAVAYTEIGQLGSVTGHKRAAVALIARMKRAIKKAVASTPKRPLSVYHELTPDLYSATSRRSLPESPTRRPTSSISTSCGDDMHRRSTSGSMRSASRSG